MTDTSKPPYPADWKEISLAIRERSGGRCECVGECGLHQGARVSSTQFHHVAPRRCLERNGAFARWARGKVMLTVAHLDHDPAHCWPGNLKAMCQRCHLRYDQVQHMTNAHRTRDRKSGQRRLPI